jgi:hypothetical protein
LAPSIHLRKQLDALMRWVVSADRAAQERASLPLLRLFGLACTDGMLRRGASGPLAARFAALLAVHETWVEARAAQLLVECQADWPGGAFETLCLV